MCVYVRAKFQVSSIILTSFMWQYQVRKTNTRKNSQIVCYIIKINNKKHLIIKNFANKKIAKKIKNCYFQVLYLLQLFSI